MKTWNVNAYDSIISDFRMVLYLGIAFIALLPGLFMQCAEKQKTITDSSLEKGAEISIGNFYRQSISKSGVKEWDITANRAYIFMEKGEQARIIAYDFSFRQFDKNKKKITDITAIRGDINKKEQKLYLTGKVVFRGANNRIISAEKMNYDWETKIMRSDVEVVIQEKGLFTRCRGGILVEHEKERQICYRPAGIHSRMSTDDTDGVDDIFQ